MQNLLRAVAAAMGLVVLLSSPRASAQDTSAHEAPQPRSWLELSAGPRAVRRSFSYSDEAAALFPQQRYPSLAPFNLGLGPAAFAALELFPGALASSGAGSQLGVVANYERAFSTSVLFAEGTAYERKLDTRSDGFFLGLKGRLPLSAHELSASVGYGGSRYEVLGDEATPVVPDVSYRYIRVDAAARLALGAPYLRLHVGTRFVTATGALERDWFPQAKAQCIEGGAAGGYRLSPRLELELAVDYLRYGFDFNPIPATTDPTTRPVAGGALDEYLNFSLALRYRFDGAHT